LGFPKLETDFLKSFIRVAGGEPRGRIQFRFVATAHLVKVMCGNGQNPSPDPQDLLRCSRSNRLYHKQMLLLWELWINKKITEFDASIMTLAAFNNG